MIGMEMRLLLGWCSLLLSVLAVLMVWRPLLGQVIDILVLRLYHAIRWWMSDLSTSISGLQTSTPESPPSTKITPLRRSSQPFGTPSRGSGNSKESMIGSMANEH